MSETEKLLLLFLQVFIQLGFSLKKFYITNLTQKVNLKCIE